MYNNLVRLICFPPKKENKLIGVLGILFIILLFLYSDFYSQSFIIKRLVIIPASQRLEA
jgi:hypothetical protein